MMYWGCMHSLGWDSRLSLPVPASSRTDWVHPDPDLHQKSEIAELLYAWQNTVYSGSPIVVRLLFGVRQGQGQLRWCALLGSQSVI